MTALLFCPLLAAEMMAGEANMQKVNNTAFLCPLMPTPG